jgi:hypothetical protein
VCVCVCVCVCVYVCVCVVAADSLTYQYHRVHIKRGDLSTCQPDENRPATRAHAAKSTVGRLTRVSRIWKQGHRQTHSHAKSSRETGLDVS